MNLFNIFVCVFTFYEYHAKEVEITNTVIFAYTAAYTRTAC
jgi:hypothetical protein